MQCMRETLKSYKRHKWLFYLLLPAIIYTIIFKYIPIYGVQIAFREYFPFAGFWGSEWVGFEHFRKMFNGIYFLPVLRNTLIISFYKIVFGFPAPIILCIMLNEVRRVKFKKVVQTVSYLPHFLSWVVLAGLVIEVLSPSRGIVNYLLGLINIDPIFFMGEERWFRTILVVSSIWKSIGWNSIIYLAAITNIDPSLYEVAEIDGAGRLRKIRHVTIPGITPVIIIMFIFAIGSMIKDDFQQIYNLLNANVLSVGEVISTYTYREGLQNMNYSYATAVGLFQNVIAFILVMGTNYLARHFNENALF